MNWRRWSLVLVAIAVAGGIAGFALGASDSPAWLVYTVGFALLILGVLVGMVSER